MGWLVLLYVLIVVCTHMVAYYVGVGVGKRTENVRNADTNDALRLKHQQSLHRLSEYAKMVADFSHGPAEMRHKLVTYIDAEKKQ